MAEARLKQKIHDVLKHGFFKDPDDAVDVSDGDFDDIHLVVFSRKFDGHYGKAKRDLIWKELVSHLTPDEWGYVSLAIPVSPEDVKTS
jgi:hypothetical protein